MQFSEFSLHESTTRAIKKLGFETATAIQAKAIPPVLEGKDLIASAETGSGKTGAYLIPIYNRLAESTDTVALVLAPTRELVQQIADTAREMGSEFKVTAIVGGGNYMKQDRDLRRFPRLIIATPGRLIEHLGKFRDLFSKTTMVVLDEADRMLELGFTAALRQIRSKLSSKPQALLFSATFPSDVAEIARDWLSDPLRITVGSTAKPALTITQTHSMVPSAQKDDELLKEINERSGSILVFARTKRRVDKVVKYLKDYGVQVARIHGGCRQRERNHAISSFRAEKFKVLVATDIAARGLDIPHIDHVINYDLPVVAEDYLHRIGRTGRAGRKGASHCLVAPEERSHWQRITRLISSDSLPSTKELYGMRAELKRTRTGGGGRRSNQERGGFGGRSSYDRDNSRREGYGSSRAPYIKREPDSSRMSVKIGEEATSAESTLQASSEFSDQNTNSSERSAARPERSGWSDRSERPRGGPRGGRDRSERRPGRYNSKGGFGRRDRSERQDRGAGNGRPNFSDRHSGNQQDRFPRKDRFQRRDNEGNGEGFTSFSVQSSQQEGFRSSRPRSEGERSFRGDRKPGFKRDGFRGNRFDKRGDSRGSESNERGGNSSRGSFRGRERDSNWSERPRAPRGDSQFNERSSEGRFGERRENNRGGKRGSFGGRGGGKPFRRFKNGDYKKPGEVKWSPKNPSSDTPSEG